MVEVAEVVEVADVTDVAVLTVKVKFVSIYLPFRVASHAQQRKSCPVPVPITKRALSDREGSLCVFVWFFFI